jgi:hypothetical protein
VLVHTCRRWRHAILESSTSLQLHLYCTHGKLTVDLLKFSPPHPLDNMFFFAGERAERPMSTKDEEGGSLALHCANWQQHHRVRFIGLREPALQELLPVLDKPFLMLEDLTLTSSHPYYRSRLPETFSAPRLRHLDLVQVGDIPNFLPCKISRVTPLTHTSTRVLVPRVRRLTAGSL